MAITRRPKPEPLRRPHALAGAVALLACLAAAGARAQSWGLDLGIASELTWTSNSALGQIGGPDDTILSLRPRMRVHGEGARLKLSGSAELNGVAYADKTQPSRVDPRADLNARLEAIERLFFVEVGYRATQTSESVFGVRSSADSTNNRLTISQWRLSPEIAGVGPNELRYRLRSDNTRTRQHGARADVASDSAAGRFARHSASLGQEPRPFGWRLEAERSTTRYDDPTEDPINIDLVRATLSYAVGADWTVGLRGGKERNDIGAGDQRRHTVYGFETRWEPSPRTTLTAFRETRAFATAWDLAFTHRHQQLAWNLALSRGLDTTPQSLFELPATDNVAGLLDALLTTRYPNPAERASAVQELIAELGLPSSTTQPTSLFSQRFSLVTSRRLSVSLLGKRNTLTLSGFSTDTRDALNVGSLGDGSSQNNNVQRGVGLVFSHSLTPLAALSAGLEWSRTRGVGVDEGDETTQETANLQVTLQVAPKTSAVFGGRYRKLDSTVVRDGQEGAVFMGLDHRF